MPTKACSGCFFAGFFFTTFTTFASFATGCAAGPRLTRTAGCPRASDLALVGECFVVLEEAAVSVRLFAVGPAVHMELENSELNPQLQPRLTIESFDEPRKGLVWPEGPVCQHRGEVARH